jgi:glycosyltransferase involved in cell wall biosynthesis
LKLLTIVVPSYNVEKTLSATLDSLCVGEVLPKLDIIVVDDGSKDGTAKIAGGFAQKHPESIRVIRKNNGGHGSTINTGIEAAWGRYFKVVDGDDRLCRDGLIALVRLLEICDADLVASNYKKVLPNGTDAGDMVFSGVEYNRKELFEQLPTDGSVYFGIHSSTFKTEILKTNIIRIQEHTFYVDTEYALLPIPFVHTVEFLSDFVYLYTVGSAQQSIDTQNFVKRYDDHLRVVTRLVGFAGSCAADKPQKDYIYSVLGKLCFTQYMLAAFYDENLRRGRRRAREFDAWLRSDARLYTALSKSMYIRFIRATGFKLLPRGAKLKRFVRSAFGIVKRLTGKKKLTY